MPNKPSNFGNIDETSNDSSSDFDPLAVGSEDEEEDPHKYVPQVSGLIFSIRRPIKKEDITADDNLRTILEG